MVSTMELYSLGRILELEPELRRGWTYPKVTKDWTSKRWAKAPMLAALVAMRQRLPGLAAEKLPKFGVEAMWVYHPLVSRPPRPHHQARRGRADRLDRRRPRPHAASWSPPASTASAPTTPASSPHAELIARLTVSGVNCRRRRLDGAGRRRRRRVAAASCSSRPTPAPRR